MSTGGSSMARSIQIDRTAVSELARLDDADAVDVRPAPIPAFDGLRAPGRADHPGVELRLRDRRPRG